MTGGSGNWQRTNVYGGGALLATYDAGGLHFHLADPLGTRRLQTSAAGVPELDCQSLPFGDQQYCFTDPNAPASADDASPLHYAGLEADPESGLDAAMYRQYQPALGRWQSPDPYSGSYDWSDPQSLNRYAYVSNRPAWATDPSGLDGVPIGGGCASNPFLLAFCIGVQFIDFGGVSGGVFHGSLTPRPSVTGVWNETLGMPAGSQLPTGDLASTLQGVLGLPTMADVGCNPICDATNGGTDYWTSYQNPVSTCLGKGLFAGVMDLTGLSILPDADLEHWRWSSDKLGFVFVPDEDSASFLGPSAEGLEKLSEQFRHNEDGFKPLLREWLRTKGIRVSSSEFSAYAEKAGKMAGRMGKVLAAYSAWDAYNRCRQ
jgi:RHS repeat-associated protein